MHTDERYMRLALALAAKAEGMTSPNPAVGAVIVKRGAVVGRGYHRRCGLPHAEVNALRDAGTRARGATMYVTLEPCDHFGRTGPCTRAIIESGIRKVVIAMRDPNPLTNGSGIRALRAHGVRTVVGVLEREAQALNRPFAKFMRERIPYVTLKIAQSLDGRIATRTGDARWISSEASRRYVHAIRGKVDGVMVGVNTVLRDDPRLLSAVSRRQPARVIVDSSLRTPPGATVVRTARLAPVYIATTKRADPAKAARLESKGVRVLFVTAKAGRVALRPLAETLGELGMTHLLVEGGGELAAGLLEEKLADELIFFVAPKIIGGRGAVPSIGGAGVRLVKDAVALKEVSVERVAGDILIRAGI